MKLAQHTVGVPEREAAVPSISSPSQVTHNRVIAYKKYIECFYEEMFQNLRLRHLRRERLESSLDAQSVPEKKRKEARKQLFKKETEYMRLKRGKITGDTFETIKIIGRGAFGEVRLVRMKGTHNLYAMKKMKKSDMIKYNQVAHARAERDLMAANKYMYKDNPWVVDLVYSFTDEKYLYLIMSYVPGGDLMTLLIRHGVLAEDQARFYIAEIIMAVDSVHKLHYIHRDVKPDNLLIDRNGHLKLSDFGLCLDTKSTGRGMLHNPAAARPLTSTPPPISKNLLASWRQARRDMAHSTVGTPDYIAPEALLQRGYHEGSDWWSVGVILYEMLYGYPPFCADTPLETYQKILRFKTVLSFPFSPNVSRVARDLILKLLCDESERLQDVNAIKSHPFFKGIDWENLRSKKAPIIPRIAGPLDTSNFDLFEERKDSTGPHKGVQAGSPSIRNVSITLSDGSVEDQVVPSLSNSGTHTNTPRILEKLDRCYTVNDPYFVGYAFRSFDVVNTSFSNSPFGGRARPRSTQF